jgi:hypothetical protein
MATLDVIDNRFFDHKIKTNVVINEQKVQNFGDVTIAAPAGLTFDFTTGLFNLPVTVEQVGSPQLLTNTILPGKIVNQGIVTVNVLVNGTVSIQNLQIPWQDVVDVPGISQLDLVQKHDFQIEGFSIAPVLIAGALNLIVKVVYEYCLIAATERVIKVNAADLFCP